MSAVLITVCIAPSLSNAEPEGYSVIRVGTVKIPDDFNPFEATTSLSHSIIWMTYEMLHTTGPDLAPHPQLAESYMVSEDGKKWTFNLSADSYWHDGLPVTAHDANFTFNMILRNEAECGLLGGYLQNVTDVRALDNHTLQVTTDVAKSTMLSINVPILPEHLWSEVEQDEMIDEVDMWDETYFPDGPVGSGPLILVEYRRTEGLIRMLKFEDYHMGPVNVDEVQFIIYTTEYSMATALEYGDIDVALDVPPTLWDSLLATSDIDGQVVSTLDIRDFGFNCASQELRESTDPIDEQPNFPQASTNLETTNLSVRKAVAMAINKTEILEDAVMGFGQEGDSIVPTATPFWHCDVPEEDEYEFDIAAANALLNNSGYNRDDDEDGIRENETSGAELSFSFYYIITNAADQVAAEKIEGWLSQIGIEAPAQGVPEGVLYTYWLGMVYDLFIWNWQLDPDPSFILSVLTTEMIPENSKDKTAWSDVYYSNAVYDQLYIEQLRETDVVERQAIVHCMQGIAYWDCPYVVLYYPSQLVAYRTDEFTNYPNMTTYPGMAPDRIWFYFDLAPIEDPNPNPPYNVYAGADRTASYGETLEFTGYAEDDDDPPSSLNWSWEFAEPDLSVETLYGQTVNYTFENPGTVEVTLTVRDPIGSSDSDDLLVEVSLPPPPVTLALISGVEGNDGWYVSSVDVELSATAVAGVASTYYSLNSEEWEEYAEPFTIVTEGENMLAYYSVDSYGTNETHKTAQISVDTVAPESSIVLTGTVGTDGWYTSPVEVAISASDSSSGVEEISYALDDGEWTAYEAEFAVEADGDHSLLVRSEDVAGNMEEAQLEEFRMDCTNPELLITSPVSGTVTSSKAVTWECSDNIGISSTEISVDSLSWDSANVNDDLSFEFILDVLDGEHEIQIRVTDFAGNNVTESLSFMLDTTAPELLITSPASGTSTSSEIVTWECSDNIGVSSTEISVDSLTWHSIDVNDDLSFDYILEVLDGEQEVWIRVTDFAGNNVTESLIFTLDTTPPELQILTPSEGAVIRGNDVEISWESSDNILVKSTEINIDGNGWTTLTISEADGTLSLELGHGEHTVQLRVSDSAGNENVSSVTFEVDSSAFSFGGPYYGLPLVGLIAAIVAAVALSARVLRARDII